MPENSAAIPKELDFSSALEKFVRENEQFKNTFGRGIDQHIRKLKLSLQTDDEEVPDIQKTIDEYSELKKVILSGFSEYEFRCYRGSPRQGSIILFLSRSEDLLADDPTKLDLSGGQRKFEYAVIINKTPELSNFSNDPARVVEGRGAHLEVFNQSVHYSLREKRLLFDRHVGYSVNIHSGGTCTGKATKYDGYLPYDSRKPDKIASEDTTSLLSWVKRLGI